jgi:hypothetical protein
MLTHDILLLSPAPPYVGHEVVYFIKLGLVFQPRFSGFVIFFYRRVRIGVKKPIVFGGPFLYNSAP